MPAVIFLLFNASGENAQAWGVVISTDTAFLIGALAIIKPKYPARLRIFLLTLAVVDDIGALCVIALFYSDRIQVVPLVIAVALIIAIALVRFLPAARGPGLRGARRSRCGSRCPWPAFIPRWPESRSRC